MNIAAKGSHKGKGRVALQLVLAAASLLPISAFADSTTGTTVTISGTPTPGKQITATVVVTGKHLVDGPQYTVPGGNVQLTLNGTLVAQVRASWANSNVYEYGCVDSACGLYVYRSQNTTVNIPITLPSGQTSYQFVGTYTGDQDSHSSTSPAVVVKPVYPDISAAVNLLLND